MSYNYRWTLWDTLCHQLIAQHQGQAIEHFSNRSAVGISHFQEEAASTENMKDQRLLSYKRWNEHRNDAPSSSIIWDLRH